MLNLLQTVKILLPHVGLIVLLLSFISFGAMVFIWLEAEQELRGRRIKLEQVLRLHSIIINQTMQLCSLDRHVVFVYVNIINSIKSFFKIKSINLKNLNLKKTLKFKK